MSATARPRVVCMTPVRNEAWMLETFLRAASLWADDIVVSDQCSDDGSREIAARFEKVHLVRNDDPAFHEGAHRTALVAAARRLVPGPRVLVGLDADEVVAATILESAAWRAALLAPPGTPIEMPFWNVRPGFSEGWLIGPAARAVVDDGAPFERGERMHVERIPRGALAPAVVADAPLLHYQHVDPARVRSKHRWYQCVERLAEPRRSAIAIFRRYHHADAIRPSALRPLERAWFAGYERRGVDPFAVAIEGRYWWDRRVLDLLDEHGAARFAREWIWDADWVALGRSLGRERPERYADPRGPLVRLLHAWLLRSQPFAASRPLRAPDRVLRWLGA